MRKGLLGWPRALFAGAPPHAGSPTLSGGAVCSDKIALVFFHRRLYPPAFPPPPSPSLLPPRPPPPSPLHAFLASPRTRTPAAHTTNNANAHTQHICMHMQHANVHVKHKHATHTKHMHIQRIHVQLQNTNTHIQHIHAHTTPRQPRCYESWLRRCRQTSGCRFRPASRMPARRRPWRASCKTTRRG